MPKLKMSAPSTKNGRFSARKVSYAVRFTTEGSASTWPKSGLSVPLTVRLDVSPYLKSAPAFVAQSEARKNGSRPEGAGARVTAATV
ncbi:MAG: hypothetical protein FIB01_03580 [Gemmatimonadetes bacterium]|nr:hypothetical protein [Gemmatimonadota bacterium]